MTAIDPKELTDRYVALWNETDAGQRRTAIRELWAEDAVHILQPPEEISQAAEALGFISTALEARGHEALELRVNRAHDEFVAPGTFTFRSRGDAGRLRDVVTFTWEMVPLDGGEVAGAGREVLVLGRDGRITADYQFIGG